MTSNPMPQEDLLGISVRTKNEDEMSEATAKIGKLWQTVWGCFADDAQLLKRAYTTDYEVYPASGGVELYIAVK